ncbi:MAG: ammonium transporter [Actinomycetota bacterium]
MKRRFLLGGLVAVLAVVGLAGPAGAQDDAGAQALLTQTILDNIFVFVAGVLVFFMQAGFAMVEAGLTRAKSSAAIMMKNMMDMCIGVLLFALVGMHIAYSGEDLVGFGWYFGDYSAAPESGLGIPVDFFFQAAFAAAAATIVSGALAERTKYVGYMAYTAVITAVIYPIVVNWQWGGGWLAQQGFHDFAGSTIVHSVGGWAALMGAIVIGPRIGKFGPDGKPRAILGHSVPLAILGVFILFIGWFGFNPGSELAADLEVPRIAVTTLLSAAGGGLVAMLTIWAIAGKPDVSMTGNGILGGLVGITAGTYVMNPWMAVLTGMIAGVIVVFSVLGIERAGVDDPVGAVSVHGVCGAWGTIAVGLFASRDATVDPVAYDDFVGAEGLFFGGGGGLLVDQIVGVVAVFAFVCVTAGALFFALKSAGMLRVSPEEEAAGLDVSEHGAPGYGELAALGGTTATPTPSEGG